MHKFKKLKIIAAVVLISLPYEASAKKKSGKGKKAQTKAIIALIDDVMAQHRFVRTFCNPIQNFNDATIYRMTARYRRRITDTEFI